MLGCQSRRCRQMAVVSVVACGFLFMIHMTIPNSQRLILSGASNAGYEGNAWVMYFANDSVAGVFEAKPQENKKPVPSVDKEATAHIDKEVVSHTGKEASPSAVRVAVTHSDNKEQVTENESAPTKDNSSTALGEITFGSMQLALWLNCKGNLVDDLRMDKRFPKSPSTSDTVDVLKYTTTQDELGVRISGFVKPVSTGKYKFGIASDDTSELWLSTDDDPQNLRKIACVGCIDQDHLPAKTLPLPPPTWVKEGVFTDHPLQISKAMSLSSDRLYYMEVYLKNVGAKGFVDVKWQTPDSTGWEDVPSSQLGHKQDDQAVYKDLPSLVMQRPMKVHYKGDETVPSVVLKGVLPVCTTVPKNGYPHSVSRYAGYLEIKDSSAYPDDHTLYHHDQELSAGNPIVEQQRVNFVTDAYRDALKASEYGKISGDFKLRLLEETAMLQSRKLTGWRYLLEAELRSNSTGQPTYISEYIYRPVVEGSFKLCSLPPSSQWERKATVNFVLPVKNQGQWVLHLLKNLEEIYLATGDTNFTLIVVDCSSDDLDIADAMNKTRLPSHMLKLITLPGPFTRSPSIQAGADTISNPGEIIFSLDLHLTIPIGLVESIRKHTIQGEMAYAPVVCRLNDHYTENNINGRWETLGHGLFAMYKSDWDYVGGMNVKEFKEKWGGEDWELVDRVRAKGYEIFRHKYPSFVHYFHSHKGMWNSP